MFHTLGVKPTKQKIKPPSLSQKHICLAFGSEAKSSEFVTDAENFRVHLDEAWREHPEISSPAFGGGCGFYD